MAFQVDMSPLERSSVRFGQSLTGLGENILESNQQRDQERQQQDMEALATQAMSGDPHALNALYSKNPQAGQFIEQRLMQQKQWQQEEDARFQGEIALNTSKAIKKMHLMPKEAQRAYFDMLVDDPQFDIDKEDENLFENEDYRRMIVTGVEGKDAADSLFGGDEQDLTNKQRDFQTYQRLNKTDKEAAKMFALGAGFATDEKKKVFQIVDGMKIFSDGSEERINSNSKIKTPDMISAKSHDQSLKIIDKAREGQLKNAGFAITMNDGVNKVNKMIDDGYDPTSAAWVNKYLAGTTIGNLIMSEDDQTFVGSVEQMINAIARRETGAAITEFEKKDFFNRYMPVAGDKPERIKQKRSALERQFKSIRGQAGSVYDAIRVTQGFDAKQSETPKVLTDEDLLNKYGG